MKNTLDKEFRNLRKKHHSIVQNYLNELGLYMGQPRLLFYLEDHPKISQRELSEMLEISKEATSVSTRRLEKAGFIERHSCLEDRRINLLNLSDKGLKVVEDLRANFDRINNLMFADLKQDEKEELNRMLKIMNLSLEKRLIDEKTI